MAKLSFDFSAPFDEVDINEKTYRLYYDDESLRKYQKQAINYHKKAQNYARKLDDIPNMPEEEQRKTEEEGMVFVRDFIETFYGKGSYDPLYEASGKAMINFIPLIEYTLEWLDSKVPDKDKKAYYTKKA